MQCGLEDLKQNRTIQMSSLITPAKTILDLRTESQKARTIHPYLMAAVVLSSVVVVVVKGTLLDGAVLYSSTFATVPFGKEDGVYVDV